MEEIAERAEKEGAMLSLEQSVSVLTNAIEGLNGIKQHWAGRSLYLLWNVKQGSFQTDPSSGSPNCPSVSLGRNLLSP